MGPTSTLTAMKHVETAIKAVLRRVDVQSLSPAERKPFAELRLNLNDARLDIRDAEYAETREELKKHSLTADKRLQSIIEAILQLSHYNIFSPIEVAELTAQLEQIKASLQ